LLDALSIAGRESSTATVMFHTAIAERAGLTATDAKAMDILTRHGSLTAGELSQHTGLASASVTSLIDRLESRGIVRRVRDRADRRRVIVELIQKGAKGDVSFFEAMQSEFEKLVADFSDKQLETVLELMRRMTERTHALTTKLASAPVHRKTVVSQFESRSQSVRRAARLGGNVRQPNQVIND
jgi:DNA-binding MarR family transcriptional regulator